MVSEETSTRTAGASASSPTSPTSPAPTSPTSPATSPKAESDNMPPDTDADTDNKPDAPTAAETNDKDVDMATADKSGESGDSEVEHDGAVAAATQDKGSAPTSSASPTRPPASPQVPSIVMDAAETDTRTSPPEGAPPATTPPTSSPSSSSSSPSSPSSTPRTLAPSEHPPRRSSLVQPPMVSSLLTPAPRASTPPAPAAPAKPKASTRVAANLAEFDPFATPATPIAPVVPPKDTTSGEATPTPAAARDDAAPPPTRQDSRSSRSSRASTDEPAFNFAGFLKDLRTKPAEPVARYLRSFLTNFSRKPFTVNEQIKLIRDFLAFIGDKMKVVEPWRSQTPAEFDNAAEAMEKLVMNRLYPYTFTPQLAASLSTTITTDDLERDAVFAQRVRLFTWVKEKHLDVPEGEQSAGFLAFAEQELLKINHYKAPRDKMICILNSCKVIFGLIRHTDGGEAGADAFVPILIFVVLRANPDNMLSNVEYINRFRNPEKLSGEAGYYLSSLQGAIAFIETMDASSLSNITQEEFESNVEQAIRDLPTSATSPRVESAGAAGSDMSPFATSPGEEPARPLTMPTTGAAALDGTKRFFQRTGDAAKEAVSRPLSAIGKILENMQAAAESESGDESDEERDRAREQWAAQHGGGELQQRHTRTGSAQPPSRLLAQLGLSPGTSESVTPTGRTPTPRTPTPDYYQQQQQGYPGAAYAQPLTPQQQQAQVAHTLEASHDAYLRDQVRLASVTTLHQMFPALGEEVVDVVLYSCGDDLGLAIDRLLEM